MQRDEGAPRGRIGRLLPHPPYRSRLQSETIRAFCERCPQSQSLRVESALSHACSPPRARGWASADAWGGDKLVVYGGLTGDDSAPLRLADTWALTVAQA